MQTQRLATVETPPDKLNLTDKCVRQAQMKRRATSQPPAQPQETPLVHNTALPGTQSSDALMQMMMMMLGTAVTTFMSNSSPGSRDCSRHKSPTDGCSPSSSPPLQHAVVPSKRSNSGIIYPELKEWLKELEDDPARNKHGEVFFNYANALVDNHKLFTIEDIISLTSNELAAVGGMEFGTASRIIRYAREDAASLKHSKKLRLR
jgi:hypothetical protein